jgi:group I intron endonuclease
MGDIYKITCIKTNKLYIGLASDFTATGEKRGYLKRWAEHISEAKNSKLGCRALNEAINKYEPINFTVELIGNFSKDELGEKEGYYIKLYNSLAPSGYNLRSSGKNNFHSEETKIKISNANKGKNHPLYGKVYTAEERLKLSKARKNDDLPIYMVYVKARPEQYCSEGYSIIHHPCGKCKYFTSKKSSLIEKYDMALKYLNTLNNIEKNAQRLDGNGSN